MANTDKIGSTLVTYCARCEGERNCEIKGYSTETGEESDGFFHWWKSWYLLKCRGCDYTFSQTVSFNSEDFDHDYDSSGKTITTCSETIETWPARAERETPAWFEAGHLDTDEKELDALNRALREIYGALEVDLLVSASMGVRTALDISAVHFGANPESPFKLKIRHLATKHQLSAAGVEKIEVLVDAGSAAAHRGWQPDQKQIITLIDALEEFLYNAFIVPSKKRAAEAELARLKTQIPKRGKDNPQ